MAQCNAKNSCYWVNYLEKITSFICMNAQRCNYLKNSHLALLENFLLRYFPVCFSLSLTERIILNVTFQRVITHNCPEATRIILFQKCTCDKCVSLTTMRGQWFLHGAHEIGEVNLLSYKIDISRQERMKGKRVHPPYRPHSHGNPSLVIFTHGTQFSSW